MNEIYVNQNHYKWPVCRVDVKIGDIIGIGCNTTVEQINNKECCVFKIMEKATEQSNLDVVRNVIKKYYRVFNSEDRSSIVDFYDDAAIFVFSTDNAANQP